MASVESQVWEKVDTAVLVKSSELFGRSMAAFLETELDYIGYLREKKSYLAAEVTQSRLAPTEVKKKSVDPPGGGGGGFGFFDMLRAKPRRPGGIRKSWRSERRYQRSIRNTNQALKSRGLTPQQTQVYRNARAGGANVQQALAQAKNAVPKGSTVPGSGMLGNLKGALGGASSFLGRALLLYGLYEQTKKVFNPNDNIFTALGDLGTSTYNLFQSDPNQKKLYDVRGEGQSALINEAQNQRILRQREEYANSEPKFANGVVATTPTRGLFGEAGVEVLIPLHKIGEAIAAVYREGGSVMVGATLAFLSAVPASPANAGIMAEAARLRQRFGVSGDFSQIRGIGTYKVKPIKSTESSVLGSRQSTSADESHSGNIFDAIKHYTGSFTSSLINSILGGPAYAADMPGNLLGTGVVNEVTAGGLLLQPGERDSAGNVGHADVGVTDKFGWSAWRGRMHRGVDIGTTSKTGYKVAFKQSGTVSLVGQIGGYGNTVIINTGAFDFLFGHLANFGPTIKEGAAYNGETIGEIGNTGMSIGGGGHHLHFEKRPAGGGGGTQMDPIGSIGLLEIGKSEKAVPKNNLRPPAPPPGKTTVNNAPVTTTSGGGGATPATQPVPIPVPQIIKQMVPVPVKEAVKQIPFVMDIFGKGGGKR